MNTITTRIGRRRKLAALPLILLTLQLSACDTAGLLEVDLPGNVAAGDVEEVGLATIMRNSAIGDFECVWDAYVTLSALHSDEYLAASGNIQRQRSMLRQITADFQPYATGSCSSGNSLGIFTPMHTARVMTENHFDRLSEFSDAEVPERVQYMAEMRAYGGYTYVAFGEGFCGTPLDAGDRILDPNELLQMAVDHFTEAMQYAQQAGDNDILNMARVGRARANLDLGNNDAAIADASQVPDGYARMATREADPSNRVNKLESINRNQTNRSGTVARRYRDLEWKGVKDPRVNTWNTGFVGHDNASIIWIHDKVTSQAQDRLIADWREARLYEAEAHAVKGELADAIAILQSFHEAAGLPDVTAADLPTKSDVIEHVIQERQRELFVEGGERLRDQLHWRGTEHEIPFLGEPGSEHPNGVNDYGQPYGTTTCYPVPIVETAGMG
jgi:hypothetical protein